MKRFYAFLMAAIVAAVSFAHVGKQPVVRQLPVQRVSHRMLAQKPVQRKAAKRLAPAVGAESTNYVRVSTAPANWSGQYLIVYEEGSVAMNGGLTDNLDVVENTVPVSIVDQEIEATEAMDAASFTIAEEVMDELAIKSHSGLYIGWETQGGNGLLSSADTPYSNQFFIDADGNAVIYAGIGDAYLRFNSASNQNRFRYYKSATYANQQPIALYKKGGEKTEPVVPKPGGIVEVPENAEIMDYTMVGIMTLWTGEDWTDSEINKTVQVAFDGSDIYIQGLSFWFPEAWAKGTVTDGKVLIYSNQLMGVDEYGDDYFVAYTNDDDYAVDKGLIFDLDAKTGVMTIENWYGETDAPNQTGLYNYCETLMMTPGELPEPELVVVPEGLTLIQYNVKALQVNLDGDDEDDEEDWDDWEDWENWGDEDGEEQDWTLYADEEGLDDEGLDDEEDDEIDTFITFVAFDGNDVYVQGLNPLLPEAWVKGTRKGNTITLPSGQYLGNYQSMFGEFPMYFAGTEDYQTFSDIQLTMSEDGSTITSDDFILVNSTPLTVKPYAIYTNTVMTRVDEKVAVPATPYVNDFEDWDEEYGYGILELCIPSVDVEGNPLTVMQLSYVVYVDEKGTISPYTFTASDYEFLEADITEVPYLLNDNYDFSRYGEDMMFVSLNAPTQNYDRIGVQSIYRGGGVENKSDISWYTIEREGDYNGIQAATASELAGQAIYSLSGQRVSRPVKGIYVQNGKKVVVR